MNLNLKHWLVSFKIKKNPKQGIHPYFPPVVQLCAKFTENRNDGKTI